MTRQHHPDTYNCHLTREGYPVVFLLSLKIEGPEGFAPIPSSAKMPCGRQLHRRYSHRVGFQIYLRFCVLKSVGFYSGQSANPTTNLLKKVTHLKEDIHRHSWA